MKNISYIYVLKVTNPDCNVQAKKTILVKTGDIKYGKAISKKRIEDYKKNFGAVEYELFKVPEGFEGSVESMIQDLLSPLRAYRLSTHQCCEWYNGEFVTYETIRNLIDRVITLFNDKIHKTLTEDEEICSILKKM